ncbi:predicted protein [Botrytis cinerea T4]|uniref:Uncharacterized protein n=1 Tax=Botryotinia fuckeliana (strain T4) TaxID=999810 RepID=G2YU59_BOTF4|nr:predicted protein [Botrytis cinerea T4]
MLQAFNEERLTPYLVKTPVPTGRNCQLKSPRALHSSIWIYLAAFNHPHFSDCAPTLEDPEVPGWIRFSRARTHCYCP